ncbi:MAG: 2Fe-2S iron-sulfur cluster-binding protein, partial [Defluviitaleaceae bacterium]|nr:2Fe-2S iron-sulfur cluster-binding protein [Defluviitaleaceae bacterium]
MTITINGQACQGAPGQTILSLAQQHNIYIPTLCHVQDLTPSGACGLCVVEVAGTPRLLRACATPITNGMAINTDTEKVRHARKTLLELSLSTHTGDCKAPCQLACPAETDCQGYIALVAAGKNRQAVQLMKEAHPFPASIARVCPRPCEENCRRALVDEAVNIAGIKRYAADIYLNQNELPDMLPDTGKKVAIVG